LNLAIVGSGYVGLVTGACFAEMGNKVICVDNDDLKISNLKNGIIPIWEPGLELMISRNLNEKRICFTTDLGNAVYNSEIIFIAVGTPQNEDGSADLQYVLKVAEDIASNINEYKIIVLKSTVPVGTSDKVETLISNIIKNRGIQIAFDIVSNPEFLKEGAAIEDFMKPDRIIIGSNSETAISLMKKLYSPFNVKSDRIIVMTPRSSEMTKYAANAMLATKISFINEIALLCEYYKADISEVRQGIGSDNRIGYKFLYPGVGYGGSCFPKDVKALIQMAKDKGINPEILIAVEKRNSEQKKFLYYKIIEQFGEDLHGFTFGIWGLSFKPQTDDMREAPSIVIIKHLLNSGAKIKAYDPVAIFEAQKYLPPSEQLIYVYDQYEAIEDVDALLLITEWFQFRNPDFYQIKKLMKQAVIFDGRNQYNPEQIRNIGFIYYGIGRL